MVPLLVYSNLEFFFLKRCCATFTASHIESFLVEFFQIKVLISIEVFIQIE